MFVTASIGTSSSAPEATFLAPAVRLVLLRLECMTTSTPIVAAVRIQEPKLRDLEFDLKLR